MGIATYSNGGFRLVVSVRHDATQARLDEWRASFQHASQMLFDATLGQQRFGEILVANRSMGGAEADCWLMEPAGQSVSSHGFARPGEHSTLMGDERSHPFIILHEFSHYAYDVFDEYTGDGGGASCIGGSTANACIMEFSAGEGDSFAADGSLIVGRVKHYCVAANHDPDGDTRQDQRRGHSCWESMVVRFSDLVMPAAPPPTQSPGNVPNIRWVVLAPEQRYMLVIDRSASMRGAKLREAQVGSHWWVDGAVLGDRLGSVSFSDSASLDRHLEPIATDADRQPHHAAIDAWVAAGNTAIGSGLRTALDEILGLGQRAATQVAVLLTDGLQNRGEDAAHVAPDLIDAGVRVYVVGIGPTVSEELLNAIASQTGGRFLRIDPSLSEGEQASKIRTALEELSIEARDNGGIVTSEELSAEPGSVLRRTVQIEAGSARATFLLSRQRPKDAFTLRVTDPGGTVFSAAGFGSGMRVINSVQPYVGIQVDSPRAGSWKVEVRAGNSNPPQARYHLLVGSENPKLGTSFHAVPSKYRLGAKVRIHLRVFAPFPVAGIKIKATLFSPSRVAPRSILLRDDGRGGDDEANDGAYTAEFDAPRVPGTYHVRAVVKGGSDVSRFAPPDVPPNHRERDRRGVVPDFVRTLEATFIVVKG
jgi:hypothetical protein